jgi:glycosyltransferase involved in cell wall biosynthesis
MAIKKAPISIAIATFNEAKNLKACLDSVVEWTSQIVVVDGGSSDQTVQIARAYNAEVSITDNPAIFHINKQKALERCKQEWILQLDADEVIPQRLKEEILSIIASPKSHDGYFVPRKNYFLGHWLSKGGQYPDFVIRFFKQGKGEFPSKHVHEQIRIAGTLGYLSEPMLHFTSRTKADYWRKADAYTTLTAESWRVKGLSRGVQHYVYYMFVKPILIFFTLFIRHKGIVDGYWGLLFAWYSALHYPIAYQKYLQMAST